jgi:mannitol/fructose-specific phosphotransferase system IIA component (Ntr-type)
MEHNPENDIIARNQLELLQTIERIKKERLQEIVRKLQNDEHLKRLMNDINFKQIIDGTVKALKTGKYSKLIPILFNIRQIGNVIKYIGNILEENNMYDASPLNVFLILVKQNSVLTESITETIAEMIENSDDNNDSEQNRNQIKTRKIYR